jgi:hypothetical protein
MTHVEKIDSIIKPFDILLVNSKSILSFIIQKISEFFSKDPVNYTHVGIVMPNYKIIEASSQIKETELGDFLKNRQSIKIIRYHHHSDKSYIRLTVMIKSLLGYNYGYFRLFLQLLDQVTNTNIFTSLIKHKTEQVCSSFIAWAYYCVYGVKFNKVDWYSCEPDDIEDEANSNLSLFKSVYELNLMGNMK